MKKSYKFLLLSSALLMPLSLLSVNSPVQAKSIRYTHKSVLVKHHYASHESITKIAIKDAKRDFNKAINDKQDDSNNFNILNAHPYYYHNHEFLNTYVKTLMKSARRADKENKYLDSVDDVKAFKRYLPKYQKLSYTQKLGVIRSIRDDTIPKRYQHNSSYIKGYLFGYMYTNDFNYKNNISHLDLSDLNDLYTKDNCKVSPYKLIGKKKARVFNSLAHLENNTKKNAWTYTQMVTHAEKIMNHLHLSRNARSQFEQVIDPDTANNTLPLAKSKFASSVYPHRTHQNLYVSKDNHEVEQGGDLGGVMINLHNNHATKKTAKDFRRYMRDYVDYHAENVSVDVKDKNYNRQKSYVKHWQKQYTNRNYKGKANTDFAQWRLITPKHRKNGSVMFISPRNGWNYFMVKD